MEPELKDDQLCPVCEVKTSINDDRNSQDCVRLIQLFGCLLVNVQSKPKAGQ